MKESEKLIERNLSKAIKKLGGMCFKFVPKFFTGLPDRICLLPGGVVFFVETKSTGDTLRPRQKLVRNLLENLGFKVYKVDSTEDIKNIVEYYE